MENFEDIVKGLTDKDDMAACKFAGQIAVCSAESDKYLGLVPVLAGMLQDKSSYVRTRAFGLICNQARWDNQGLIESVFDQMVPLLNDPKPTVVRQCLGAMHELVLYRPEMVRKIEMAVSQIDLTKYKDSMSPLIKKDMDALLKIM